MSIVPPTVAFVLSGYAGGGASERVPVDELCVYQSKIEKDGYGQI